MNHMVQKNSQAPFVFTRRLQVLLGIFVLTLLGSITLRSFVNNWELRVLELPAEQSLEARHNPYLAVFRVLNRLDMPVTLLHTIRRRHMPELNAFFVIVGDRTLLGDEVQREILEWVQDGGRLLVLPTIEFDEEEMAVLNDPILETLGIAVSEHSSAHDQEKELVQNSMALLSILTAAMHEGEEVILQPGNTTLRLGPMGSVHLSLSVPEEHEVLLQWRVVGKSSLADIETGAPEDPPLGRTKREGSPIAPQGTESRATLGSAPAYAMRVRYGKGTVTVLNGLDFLTNNYLGDHDNTTMLDEIFFAKNFDNVSAPESVLWLTDLTAPSLMAIILKHGTWALWGLIVLLILTIWRGTMRFGPIQPNPQPSRRGLLEHIRASARFHWRHNDAETLLASTRQALLSEATERLPGFKAQSSGARVKRLALLSQLSENAVKEAVAYRTDNTTPDFTRLVQRLERIRKSL